MIAFILFLVASLAALGTLLIEFFRDSIRFGGPVFVVLALAIAVYLLWTRRQLLFSERQKDDDTTVFERTQGNPATVAGMMILGVLAALFAQMLHSPYLAWVAFLYLMATVAYAEFGSKGLQTTVPVLVLLVFIRPIPSSLEPWAHLGLQASSTNITVMMLDFLRIFFFAEGNVLGLISQKELASVLFQGVHWLYLASFIAVAWGVYFRYHWFRTFLNVCHTIFWVILWNAIRSTVLLANKEWGGSWIDSSTMLSVSDFLCLALILFFAWSGDQFLSSMMRLRRAEGPSDQPSPTEMRELMSPRWRFSLIQWGLVVGLLAVAFLSVPLAGRYGWGLASPPVQDVAITLPAEIDSWKVEEATPSEFTIYDGTAVRTRSWSVEQAGKKLRVDVVSPQSWDPNGSWHSKWMGWRQDGENELVEMDDFDGPGSLARLSRLPGESKTMVTVGTDLYGQPHTSSRTWQFWYRVPEILVSNLQYVTGGATQESKSTTVYPPAAHAVTLSWPSAKPLDDERTKELKQVWKQLYPLIVSQLDSKNSN